MHRPIQTILVGYDGSAHALSAVRHSLAAAKQLEACVVLAYAVRWSAGHEGPIVPEGVVPFDHWQNLVSPEAAKMLGRLVGEFPDISLEKRVVHAAPAVALLDLIEEVSADLVVVGTHGRTGFERFMMGSVAEQVVRQAPVPVLVVRPTGDAPAHPNRVLVPTDLSDSSAYAVELALLTSPRGTTIDLVHCWHPLYVPIPGEGFVPDRSFVASGERQRAEDAARAGLKKVEATFRDQAERTGITLVSELYDTDEVARTIHGLIEEGNYNMVIMGSHGRRGLQRLVLGSVAEMTVRYANCSVMVARRPPPVL